MGSDTPVGGVAITPKYIGDRSIVQVAIATLASDRALMLVGEPGTAKSWLSEHLAAAVSGELRAHRPGHGGHERGAHQVRVELRAPPRRGAVAARARRLARPPRHARGGSSPASRRSPAPPPRSRTRSSPSSRRSRSPSPSSNEVVSAERGFNIIATANTRDRGRQRDERRAQAPLQLRHRARWWRISSRRSASSPGARPSCAATTRSASSRRPSSPGCW